MGTMPGKIPDTAPQWVQACRSDTLGCARVLHFNNAGQCHNHDVPVRALWRNGYEPRPTHVHVRIGPADGRNCPCSSGLPWPARTHAPGPAQARRCSRGQWWTPCSTICKKRQKLAAMRRPSSERALNIRPPHVHVRSCTPRSPHGCGRMSLGLPARRTNRQCTVSATRAGMSRRCSGPTQRSRSS